MPDVNTIQAIQLTYEPSDELRLSEELAGWCPVPQSLGEASVTRRVEWLAARVALKRLLGLLSLDLVLEPNSTAPYPVLRQAITHFPTAFHVSWAHTVDCVVVGVSRLPLGVDIEAADRCVLKVLDRIASEEERIRTRAIKSHDGQPVPQGLALWCGKEAMAKATGLGMKWGLKNFEFTTENGGAWLVKTHREGPRNIPTAAVGLFLRGRWLMAFAANQPEVLDGPVWN